jgi:hypothetical protein
MWVSIFTATIDAVKFEVTAAELKRHAGMQLSRPALTASQWI